MQRQEIVWMAKKQVKERGDHVPMFFIIDKEENINVVVMQINDDSEEGKKEAVDVLRKLVTDAGSSRYFYVSSAWMCNQRESQEVIRNALQDLKKKPSTKNVVQFMDLVVKMHAAPSQHPKRKECLIVSEFEKDIGTKTTVIEYKTIDGRIEFGKEDTMGESPGHSYNRFNVWTPEQYNIGGADGDT